MVLRHDLKTIVKGTANIDCVKAGGIVVYHITVEDFMAHYDKAIILMRWIRRAIDNNELYPLN